MSHVAAAIRQALGSDQDDLSRSWRPRSAHWPGGSGRRGGAGRCGRAGAVLHGADRAGRGRGGLAADGGALRRPRAGGGPDRARAPGPRQRPAGGRLDHLPGAGRARGVRPVRRRRAARRAAPADRPFPVLAAGRERPVVAGLPVAGRGPGARRAGGRRRAGRAAGRRAPGAAGRGGAGAGVDLGAVAVGERGLRAGQREAAARRAAPGGGRAGGGGGASGCWPVRRARWPAPGSCCRRARRTGTGRSGGAPVASTTGCPAGGSAATACCRTAPGPG